MKYLLAFLFIVPALKSISQSNKVLIKLPPLSLADEVSFPAIQAGAEFMLTDKISWYNEVAIKYRKSYYESADTNFVPSNGFKIKTEARYYLGNNGPFYGRYLAANIFFIHESRNTGIGYYYQKDSSIERADNFGAKRNVFGINLLGGYQHSFFNRFAFDVYAGIGIRIRSVRTSNKEYDKSRDNLLHAVDLIVNDIRDQADADNSYPVLPNLSLGFRLCYRF